jgi:hypothetical protein
MTAPLRQLTSPVSTPWMMRASRAHDLSHRGLLPSSRRSKVKVLKKRVVVGAAVGGLAVAGMALAAPLSLIQSLFDNSFLQAGVGRLGVPNSIATYYYDRYNATSDPAFPALHAYTDLPGPASAFRAEATMGIDALIGETVPDLDAEFDPSFPVDDLPTLVVADDGPMNVSGDVNTQEEVNRVSADIRGAIKLCGKSANGEAECTNQAYLYLEDGSGDLVVKFGNGDGFVIASVASASQPFLGGAPLAR